MGAGLRPATKASLLVDRRSRIDQRWGAPAEPLPPTTPRLVGAC